MDVNGDGKSNSGEPWIDLDGNTAYTPPPDKSWDQLGLAEPIELDYTNGVACHSTGHCQCSWCPADGSGCAIWNRRAGNSMRQLYCLMLLLVDDGDVAPHDENDPQVKEFIDYTIPNSTAKSIYDVARGTAYAAAQSDPGNAANHAPQANLPNDSAVGDQLRRHARCRCINDTVRVRRVPAGTAGAWRFALRPRRAPRSSACFQSMATLRPTRTQVATINWEEVIAQNYAKQVITIDVLSPPLQHLRSRSINPSSVWGAAERTDLLITETLATHDRRTEDLASDFTKQQLEANNPQKDDDLDQRLRPKGSAFVEIYNPWAQSGQHPAELYTKLLRDANGFASVVPSPGIEMGRLSTLGVDVASVRG